MGMEFGIRDHLIQVKCAASLSGSSTTGTYRAQIGMQTSGRLKKVRFGADTLTAASGAAHIMLYKNGTAMIETSSTITSSSTSYAATLTTGDYPEGEARFDVGDVFRISLIGTTGNVQGLYADLWVAL